MNPLICQLTDGRELLIRQADTEDAPALLKFLDCMSGETDFVSFGPGEFGLSLEEEVEFIGHCRSMDNMLMVLAVIDGQIVGSLNFSGGKRPRTRHTGELGMSVRKSFWSLGIGSKLMDALIAWARESSVVTKLNLRVRTDNDRAISLYLRKGFIVEGTIRRDFHVNGKYFDHYWMGLEV